MKNIILALAMGLSFNTFALTDLDKEIYVKMNAVWDKGIQNASSDIDRKVFLNGKDAFRKCAQENEMIYCVQSSIDYIEKIKRIVELYQLESK